MSELNVVFQKLTDYFSNKDYTSNGVMRSADIFTVSSKYKTVTFGINTLRFVFGDDEKNATISINPLQVEIGSYVRDVELVLQVLSSGFTSKYNRLHVDGGELFQFSTVHDFDFGILPELMTKYLELLKVLKDSPRSIAKDNVDQAIENVTKAVEAYHLEGK
ncbi:hypothetical protein ENKO_077 [Klebsiella phage fENko-Kae01]|nr:hypothetical protein [Klebsiella phage fENko-Kae01]